MLSIASFLFLLNPFYYISMGTEPSKNNLRVIACANVCLLFTLLVVNFPYEGISHFIIQYYVPSYLDNFYRRAFIGTLIYPFDNFRFSELVLLIPIFSGSLTFILLILFAYFKKNIDILNFLFFIFISGTSLSVFDNFTRPEIILYSLLILVFFINKTWAYILITLISILIHEITIFTTLPIILLHLLNQKKIKTLSAVITSSFLLFLFLLANENVPTETLNKFIYKIEQKTVHTYQFESHYYEIFTDKPDSISSSQTRWNFYFSKSDLITISIYCLVLYSFIFYFNKSFSPIKVIIFSSALAPLFLGFFAFDIFRWIPLFLINIYLVIFLNKNIFCIGKTHKFLIIFFILSILNNFF